VRALWFLYRPELTVNTRDPAASSTSLQVVSMKVRNSRADIGCPYALILTACHGADSTGPLSTRSGRACLAGRRKNLSSVWGTSESDVWAVGNMERSCHYNGTTLDERCERDRE